MKRGTKEFYEIKESFERAVNTGEIGYLPSAFELDDFNKSTFYANGEVNSAFRIYMSGYAHARCEYLNK